MALDLVISDKLEWGASNSLADALFRPIIQDIADQWPHIVECLEPGLLYGLAELNDLTPDELTRLSQGIDDDIAKRFERHTSYDRRAKDGTGLDNLLGRLRHVIRLAYILTLDDRYVAPPPDTLALIRWRLALLMVAAQCLLNNVDLGVKLAQGTTADQLAKLLNPTEREECCQAIVHVRKEQTDVDQDEDAKYINDAIDNALQQVAHSLSCQ